MKKVLIVDDDVTFQLTMGEKLTEGGYEVLKALDGVKGLETARAEKPDLILLDIRMPHMDGLEFLKVLCNEADDNKPIPVYITSNLSNMDKISEGVALGIRGYIVKSDESLDTILNAVHSVLSPDKAIAAQTYNDAEGSL